MKSSCGLVLALAVMTLATYIACAYDPSPLQDFCVATDDPKNALFVNGKFCKNPELVTSDDFFFSGLNIATNTDNELGTNVTLVNVENLPGLNTLGLSLARIDYAPYGVNPPHIHPRGTEMLFVTQGTVYAGFVSSDEDGNRFFAKILNEGDAIVFPIGTIHFNMNVKNAPAVAFVAFGSQNAGVTTIANSVFGSDPPIKPEVISRAFMLDKDLVENLQKKFGGMN